MIVINTPNKSFEVVLADAITTTQLAWIVHYEHISTENQQTLNSANGATNSTTAVTVLSAPQAGSRKSINSFSLYNADTVTATATIRLNDNSTMRTIVKVALLTGDHLIYTSASGWYVLSSDGYIKSTFSVTVLDDLSDVIFTSPATGATIIYDGVNWVDGQLDLADNDAKTGILPTANGGTGIAYFTAAGPTVVRVYTFPDAAATIARTDAGQTFTGVNVFTSPDIITSITTASTSFTAFAGATTLLTIGGTGATASLFAPSTLDATSSITGAIRTSGGLSAAKALWVGGLANVAGAVTLQSTLNVAGGSTFNNFAQFTSSTGATTGAGIEISYSGTTGTVLAFDRTGGTFSKAVLEGSSVALNISGTDKLTVDASGNTILAGTFNTDSTTDSTSISTGSIQTDGGLGVTKAAWIG